jgi:hypothetical protein
MIKMRGFLSPAPEERPTPCSSRDTLPRKQPAAGMARACSLHDWSSTMQIPVLIEPVAGNGFRATGGEPLRLTAQGATPDEALRRLREMVEDRIAAGAQFTTVEVPPVETRPAKHPWAPFAGTLKDDPLLEEWKEAMADWRRQMDADPDVL